jgi:NADH-quinone oxidoreductase subunit J
MDPVFFYTFAVLAVISAVLVVWNPLARNTVTNAMFLVVTMLSISGLFVLLQAFFMAAVQVIVYAGAVMVLFLFVIMLLDIQAEKKRRLRLGGLISGISLSVATVLIFRNALFAEGGADETTGSMVFEGSTSALGKQLFTQYLLPFEIISVLLLVAMLGVILLSKKELK